MIPTDDLLNLFEANDLRYEFFIEQNDAGNYIYSPNNPNNIFPISGVTTSELYLSRAEANVRLGNPDQALADLLLLRSKRFDRSAYPDDDSFISDVTVSAGTDEEVLQAILVERQRELMFMGLRWFDMKRLIVDGRYTKTLTRIINGETHTLEPGSSKYVVAISPEIESKNPNL